MSEQNKPAPPVGEKSNRGLMIVISAPSGTGKTSVLFDFLEHHPEIVFSVSATTRPPRTDEREDVNYHFVSRDEFQSLRDSGKLLEWNEVYGNWYGTLRKPVVDAMEHGNIVILDTDTVGAFNIKKAFPSAILIFFVPPSPDILQERLSKRNTEIPGSIEKRLAAFPYEVARMTDYDYIIVNDNLSVAVSQFSSIIEAEQLKSHRIIDTHTEWRKYRNERHDHT